VFDFLKNIFSKKKKSAGENIQTAPLSEEQILSVANTTIVCKPPQLVVGTGQSIGKQRDHNEDTLLTLNAMLADNSTELPFGIFIVADGMGGHQHGEVASGAAARSIADYLVKHLYSPMIGVVPEGHAETLQELMEAGVQEAQQAVVRRAPGGGTTLTAALVVGDQITIAHIGDSRAYFIYPDGRIQRMTQDHSLVRRLVELGQITEEEAQIHPQRNVLYRALGQMEPFRPDISSYPIPHPGYVLICSDGLWGLVPEPDIFRIITSAPNPSIACHNLVNAANEAGGPDNITAVLVQYLN